MYFRVFPRTDRSRAALEPVVGAEGGPGYPSIDSADSYLFMLGSLRRRHDLIVVDNRGTGRSGRDQLPAATGGQGRVREGGWPLRAAARRPRQRLRHGRRHGRSRRRARQAPRAASRHLRRLVRHLLRAGVRRPPPRARAGRGAGRRLRRGRLRRLGAAGIRVAALRLAPRCARARPAAVATCSPRCGAGHGDFRTTPLAGRSRDADGGRHRVRVDGAALGQIAGDASYYYTIYRDLSSALRAYERGDRAPLLRIAAEDLPFTGGGPVKEYSEGAYAAVACHDYPTIWDPAAPFAARRDQLAAARAALDPAAFAPFPNDIWLGSLYVDQLVTGCLRWPAPRYPDPPVPPGAGYPTVPVLVLDGDLDVITPLGDATRAARLFPNSTLVTVRNNGHVTALADYNDCASGIVRRFLETLAPGDVSCAGRTAEVHVVPDFPRTVAAAPPAEPAGADAGDRSTAKDRRAAWSAGWAVGDALARWWLMFGSKGHGLRGEPSRPGASTSPTGRSACGCGARASSRTWRLAGWSSGTGAPARSAPGCGSGAPARARFGSAGALARFARWHRSAAGWAAAGCCCGCRRPEPAPPRPSSPGPPGQGAAPSWRWDRTPEQIPRQGHPRRKASPQSHGTPPELAGLPKDCHQIARSTASALSGGLGTFAGAARP